MELIKNKGPSEDKENQKSFGISSKTTYHSVSYRSLRIPFSHISKWFSFIAVCRYLSDASKPLISPMSIAYNWQIIFVFAPGSTLFTHIYLVHSK